MYTLFFFNVLYISNFINIKLIIRNYYKYNNNTQTFQYHCNNCPLLLDLMGIVQSKLVYLKKRV